MVHAEIGLAFVVSRIHSRSVGSSNSSSRQQDFHAGCEDLAGGVRGGGIKVVKVSNTCRTSSSCGDGTLAGQVSAVARQHKLCGLQLEHSAKLLGG